MAADGDRPALGDEDLGVRVPTDIKPDAAGNVHPGKKGMSVVPDTPQLLQGHLRPESLGGTGTRPVWSITTGDLGAEVACVLTSTIHAVVSPAISMPSHAYREALEATRMSWKCLGV
jgi:hypothetical protein